jgi:hypothetical protein
VRAPIQDPTAGRSAQAILEDPGAPRAIRDPTDPRYGKVSPGRDGRVGDAARVLDPTDPEYGAAA